MGLLALLLIDKFTLLVCLLLVCIPVVGYLVWFFLFGS
jgi:hypothetical protein